MGNDSGKNANEPISLLDGDIKRRVELPPLSVATPGVMASLHGSMCSCIFVYVLSVSVGVRQRGKRGWRAGEGGDRQHDVYIRSVHLGRRALAAML